jgi:hypothetical protein
MSAGIHNGEEKTVAERLHSFSCRVQGLSGRKN